MFGRLKARWVFCATNSFWNEPEFVRDCTLLACCLHNWVETRGVAVPEADVDALVAVAQPVGQGDAANTNAAGNGLRVFLTAAFESDDF